jgi:hypothetical protein
VEGDGGVGRDGPAGAVGAIGGPGAVGRDGPEGAVGAVGGPGDVGATGGTGAVGATGAMVRSERLQSEQWVAQWGWWFHGRAVTGGGGRLVSAVGNNVGASVVVVVGVLT